MSKVITRLTKTFREFTRDKFTKLQTTMFGFLKRKQSILIIAGICECCDKQVYNSEKVVKCYGFACTFHKKCFKKAIKDANNLAIDKGYKAKFTKKNIPCRCGNGF